MAARNTVRSITFLCWRLLNNELPNISIEMTETQITGICLGFFVEAYETSANVLSSALYQLALHPHIQEELARHIHESLAANNNEITYDLVYKNEYLEKVALGKC